MSRKARRAQASSIGDVGDAQSGLARERRVGRPLAGVGPVDVVAREQRERDGVSFGVAMRAQALDGVREQAADPFAMEPALRIRLVAARVRREIRVEPREVDAGDRQPPPRLRRAAALSSFARKPSRQVRTNVRKRALAGS